MAARLGRKEEVELLRTNGANVNARVIGWPHWTPLHEAAAANHKELVSLLIAQGAEINSDCARARGGRFGGTPMYETAFEGHMDVAELPVPSGADMLIGLPEGPN